MARTRAAVEPSGVHDEPLRAVAPRRRQRVAPKARAAGSPRRSPSSRGRCGREIVAGGLLRPREQTPQPRPEPEHRGESPPAVRGECASRRRAVEGALAQSAGPGPHGAEADAEGQQMDDGERDAKHGAQTMRDTTGAPAPFTASVVLGTAGRTPASAAGRPWSRGSLPRWSSRRRSSRRGRRSPRARSTRRRRS